MTSPHTPPPAEDLPKRVPGSGKKVSPSPTPVRSNPAPHAADRGDSLPRLTGFSSLGSRANFDGPREDRAAHRPGSGASAKDEPSPGDRSSEKSRPGGILRRSGDKAAREGLRGALGVVGVVGLLAAGAVALVLGLSGEDDDKQTGASVSVGTREDYLEDFAGDAADPSASATRGKGAEKDEQDKDGKDGKASASPSASASPESSASAKASKAPRDETHAPAGGGPSPQEETPAVPSGVSVVSHDSQRCLDVVGGQPVVGTRLMIWDCHGDSVSQRWTFASDGTMRTLDMCVQLGHGSTADGAELQLAHCNGGDAQQFELNYRHDIVSKLANKCADVQDAATDNGTRIQLWSCNGEDQQKWSRS